MSKNGMLLALGAAGIAALVLRAKRETPIGPAADAGDAAPKPSAKPSANPSAKPSAKASTKAGRESAVVRGPGADMTRVALPDAGTLQHIADDAIEAAEKAERGHIVDIGPARIDAPASPASPALPASPAAPASQGSGLASKAAEVAKNVREKKYSYSRKLVSDYQAAAGLAADGIYGPATAASLSRYTDAPKALFAAKRKAGK